MQSGRRRIAALSKSRIRNGRQVRLRLACLEANEIGLFQLDFRRVFDEENPVVVSNELAEWVQQGRLSASGSATNEDVLAVLDIPLQAGCRLAVQSAHSHEVFDCEMTAIEFADGQGDAVYAATRLPSGSLESRIGLASEMSSPKRLAMFFTAAMKDFSLRTISGGCSSAPARSMKTWFDPLIMISLIESSGIRCSIGRKNGRMVSNPSMRGVFQILDGEFTLEGVSTG